MAPRITPVDIEALAATARGFGAVVAVELQWGDFEARGLEWLHDLDVCAVVAGLGPIDSRYRSMVLTSLPGNRTEERAAAAAVVEAVAGRLGVEASLLALEREHVGGSRWIERQGKPPVAIYDGGWQAHWWSDDGRYHEGEGRERVEAPSGESAKQLIRDRLRTRLDARRRQVGIQVRLEGVSSEWAVYVPARPPTAPPLGDIRAWRRAGATVAAIARRLYAATPAPTPLDVMLAVNGAFRVELEELAPLADWAAGGLDDAGLDAALEPQVVEQAPRWDRLRRLRAAWVDGPGVAAQLRAERQARANFIELLHDLAEAFDIERGAAKMLSGLAFGNDDAEADAFLAWARGGGTVTAWMMRPRS